MMIWNPTHLPLVVSLCCRILFAAPARIGPGISFIGGALRLAVLLAQQIILRIPRPLRIRRIINLDLKLRSTPRRPTCSSTAASPPPSVHMPPATPANDTAAGPPPHRPSRL